MTRRMRGIRAVAAVGGACLVLAGVLAAPTPAAPPRSRGPRVHVFPADNVWHLDVSKLPVHAEVRRLEEGDARTQDVPAPRLRAAVLRDPVRRRRCRRTPTSACSFTYAGESDAGPYPFGPDTHVEGGSDRHAIMIDRDACTLYELYAARWNGGDPRAGSGAIFDLAIQRAASGGLDERRRRRAADLSPGLLRYDEVAAGLVDHAIRVTAACTYDAYLWPARHAAGTNDRRCPPMGARFRLKAGFDASRFSPAGARRDPRDEALRTDRRRQRQRLVLPGDGRSRGGPTPSSISSSGSPRGRSWPSTSAPAGSRRTAARSPSAPVCPRAA